MPAANAEQSIFLAALELPTPAERAAYLKEACGANLTLLANVQELLAAHEKDDGFLDHPPPNATVDETPAAERAGMVIGSYKFIEQIGEGGMGTVWMAQQTEPVKRLVAVKLIKAGMDSEQVIARFEAERQALALMDHPNIARVLDAGTTNTGRPYFVMDLVKGQPITRYCDEHRLTPRQRLGLFVLVCQAVQHAHQKGIIHRDLKPSNVLVALYDGKPVPKVIDFGVAKATGVQLTETTLVTGFGNIVGTLEYMSPEQAEINQLDIDTRSDIYSLGVLLYELLTGGPPFTRKELEKAGILEMLRMIREQEPTKPSTKLSTAEGLPTLATNRGTEPGKLTKMIRGELDWIVMKALEKDRSRRYETANSVVRDVERYLNDEPVMACPPSWRYRLGKFARRHRPAAVMGGVGVAMVLLTLVSLMVSTVVAWRAKVEAEMALDREQLSSYWQRIGLAEREWSANNVVRVQELLEICPEHLRGWEWHYLRRLCSRALKPLRHEHALFCVALSPDGKRLVTADLGGFVTIWDALSGHPLHREKAHEKPCVTVAYSQDGWHFATGDFDPAGNCDGAVKLWDARLGKVVASWTVAGCMVGALAFGPDGKLACSAGPDGKHATIELRDPTTGRIDRSISTARGACNCLAWSNDGKLLAAASLQGDVTVWDAEAVSLPRLRTWHVDQQVWGLALSPTGQVVVAACGDEGEKFGKVYLWDIRSGQEYLAPLRHQAKCVAFRPDGKRLVTGGIDGAVKIWDAVSGYEILTLRGHVDFVRAVAFSSDGHRLVSASEDGDVRIWDGTPIQAGERIGEELCTLEGHRNSVNTVAFHPREPLVATGSTDGTVKLWDSQTGKECRQLPLTLEKVEAVAFSPDGEELAVAGHSPLVTIFNTTTGVKLRQIEGQGPGDAWIVTIAFSPDGKRIAIGGGQGTVYVRDVHTGKLVCPLLTGHQWATYHLAFHPDPRKSLLATCDTNARAVRIWNVVTGKELPGLPLRHQAVTYGVTFSPDGRLLASGSYDHTVRLCDTTTWKQVDSYRDDTGQVQRLAFSPDSQLLAWGATDATIKVWQRESRQVVTLRGHTDRVHAVAFSSDGKLIASASQDGTARIWKTPNVP
jgi:WD40 repeat protein/serine/threonine protein kinase